MKIMKISTALRRCCKIMQKPKNRRNFAKSDVFCYTSRCLAIAALILPQVTCKVVFYREDAKDTKKRRKRT
jgi:hypothetical protein